MGPMGRLLSFFFSFFFQKKNNKDFFFPAKKKNTGPGFIGKRNTALEQSSMKEMKYL
jgi:hypothetical protein